MNPYVLKTLYMIQIRITSAYFAEKDDEKEPGFIPTYVQRTTIVQKERISITVELQHSFFLVRP